MAAAVRSAAPWRRVEKDASGLPLACPSALELDEGPWLSPWLSPRLSPWLRPWLSHSRSAYERAAEAEVGTA